MAFAAHNVDQAHQVTKRYFRQQLRDALDIKIVEGVDFTIDDLYSVGLPRSKASPGRVGALIAAEAKAGRIEVVGTRRSSEPGRRSGRVLVWRAKRAS